MIRKLLRYRYRLKKRVYFWPNSLVPEVNSVYYWSGGGLMCVSVCVCVCVCVSKNQKKKMSVEHGDSKKKLLRDPRIRTDLRGCTDPYEIRNSYCTMTSLERKSGIRNNNYSYDSYGIQLGPGIRTTSLWDPRNNNYSYDSYEPG